MRLFKELPSNKVFVYGIFRTGTNFTKALLEFNYDCEVLYSSKNWKHGFLPMSKKQGRKHLLGSSATGGSDGTQNLILTKNPFHMLTSLYSYSQDKQQNFNSADNSSFSRFLSSAVTVTNKQAKLSPSYWFRNPIDYWISTNWNFSSAVDNYPNFLHVRYEDALSAPEETTMHIAKKFNLKRKLGEFKSPQNKLKRLGGNNHDVTSFEGDQKFSADSVLEAKYMTNFSKADLDFVNAQLDPNFVEKLGYSNLVKTLNESHRP